MSTTAKITSKGTANTGITEDLAKRCHDQLGRKVLAVVELVAEARSEKRSGDEAVSFSILTIEPAPNQATEDHLRELARSFHYERQLADGQLTIETGDDIEPKVADVLTAGAKHRPHPFLPVDATDDDGICDVCGALQHTAVHADQSGTDDPFADTTTVDDDADPEEPDADPESEDDQTDDGDIPGDEADNGWPATNPFAVA